MSNDRFTKHYSRKYARRQTVKTIPKTDVKELPNCMICGLQRVPMNCTTIRQIASNCPTIAIAEGRESKLRELDRRNKARELDRIGTIRTKAYHMSILHAKKQYTPEQYWLWAENIIKANYPELFIPYE